MKETSVFTVSQVAAALGVKLAEARLLLPPHGADSFVLERGGSPAWTPEGLPTAVRHRLKDVAAAHGYFDVAALLASPPDRWLTAQEIIRLDALRFNTALAIRSLLSKAFVQWESWTEAGEATVQRVEAAIFQGDPERARRLGARNVRTLVKRAIRRDGEACGWQRLDPYLPGEAWCQADRAALELVSVTNRRPRHQACLYSEVRRVLCGKTYLQNSERDAVWLASFLDQTAATMNQGRDISAPIADLMAVELGCHLVSRRVSFKHFYRIWLAHFEHWKSTGTLLTYNALRRVTKQTKGRQNVS